MEGNKNTCPFWLKALIPIIIFCVCIGVYQAIKYFRIKSCIESIREDAIYQIEREDLSDYAEVDVHTSSIGVMGFIIDCDYKIKDTDTIISTRSFARGVLGNTPVKSSQITIVLWCILLGSVIFSEAFMLAKQFHWKRTLTAIASFFLVVVCLFSSALAYRKIKIDSMVTSAYESIAEEKQKAQYANLNFETDITTESVSFWKVKVTIKVHVIDPSTNESSDSINEEVHDLCPWH